MDVQRPISKQPIPDHAKKVFDGKIFEIYQWEQKLFDNTTATFEKARRTADSVGVILVTDEGKIILTKQEQPQEDSFIGAIGGRMDKGETPLDTAKREMLEESGFVADKFELLLAVHPEIKVDWVCYTFIAKGLKKAADMNLDAGEKVELVYYTFDEYMNVITQENYRDSEIALFLLRKQKNPKEFEKIRRMFIDH